MDKTDFGKKGFTILETMVVMSVIMIISAFAAPYLQQWSKNSEYRAAARHVVSVLRETRSSAINKNLEHRIEFEPENKRFRVLRGNQSMSSSSWDTVASDWQSFPAGVQFYANVHAIHLNPNGTANGGTISIQDEMHVTKYEVRVTQTGRIRIPSVL